MNEEITAHTWGKPLVMGSTVFNEDCMTVMARYPDKYFDLAIVDPPYGIDIDKHANHGGGKRPIKSYNKIGKTWDKEIPTQEYWTELFRVSKNQIIWGGNYFGLPATKCFLMWDKIQEFSGSDFELAWTSFNKPCKSFRKSRVEFHNEEKKIHPTQKTVSLYNWIFTNYSNEGNLILDTHLGSGSSRIAAHKNNLEFVGCEIDAEYFAAQEARFKDFTSQLRIEGW